MSVTEGSSCKIRTIQEERRVLMWERKAARLWEGKPICVTMEERSEGSSIGGCVSSDASWSGVCRRPWTRLRGGHSNGSWPGVRGSGERGLGMKEKSLRQGKRKYRLREWGDEQGFSKHSNPPHQKFWATKRNEKFSFGGTFGNDPAEVKIGAKF